jgi:putative hydrolase of the HAD superfamily
MPDLICIDFWNTLVRATSNGEVRRQVRHDALARLAVAYNTGITKEKVGEANQLASRRFDEIWYGEQRTPTTLELVQIIMDHLELRPSREELQDLVVAYQDSLLAGPPDLAPGIHEALAELSGMAPLSIISDTMYSPGRVLRAYMEQKGIARYFSFYVFSDETGVSKPHPKAYRTALTYAKAEPARSWHIGDIQKTDIAGAKAAGMGAILFTGLSDNDRDNTTADHICDTWEDVVTVFRNNGR